MTGTDATILDTAPAAPARKRLVGAVVAEATGTAMLVAAIVGSGIAADHAFPNSPGLALLANAIATGTVLAALITALGPVSAAFNPLVTLLDLASCRTTARRALAVIAAQLAGASVGVVSANTMFALPPLTLASTDRATGPTFLSETIATTGLLLLIALTSRTRDPLRVGVTVGGYITAAMWFTSSTAFANPAVTLARIGTDTFTGISPTSAAMFLAAQALALPIVYLLTRLITRRTP
ncbi:MAG: aquaporin [Tessaracoccus sp.]